MIVMVAILLALVAICLTFSQAKSKVQRRQIAVVLAAVVALSGGSELWILSTDWRLAHLPSLSSAGERNALVSLRHSTQALDASTEATSKYIAANGDKLVRDQK